MDARFPLSQKPHNRPRYTPARAIWAFTLGMVIISILSVMQRGQESFVEIIEYPTAVGDKSFFQLKRPVEWHRAVATLADETPLFLQSVDPVQERDAVMLKVYRYRDRYFVYRRADTTEDASTYFLKINHTEYLPIGPKPASPSESP